MIKTQKSEEGKSELKKIREYAGLSQKEAAEKLRVHEKQIGRWESGDSLPSMENAASLARLYGKSLREIYASCGINVCGIPGDPWRA